MPTILLVDDDQSVLDVLAMNFEDEGFEVRTASDGQAGLEEVRRSSPDVVISDVNMPRLDGFSFCRKLRESGDDTPVILLTSRDSDIDEALGLELGADDYVAKPFSARVLLARVRALLRRQEARGGGGDSAEEQTTITELGEVRLDSARLEVSWSGQAITVTVTEFRLLEALVSRAGIVMSRDRLMELARGDDTIVADRIIDTYVRRLRRKFEALEPGFDRIETVIGAGYRWRKAA